MNFRLNLRFLIVALLSAYIGFLGGGVWMEEKAYEESPRNPLFVKLQIDKAFSDGAAWGRAECEGKKYAQKLKGN